ncbi:MAG: hypothetical protein P8Y94_13985, partial [Acidobacteriota bacterium]
MSRRKLVCAGLMMVVLLAGVLAFQTQGAEGLVPGSSLDANQLASLIGGSFWTGLGCGFAAAGLVGAILSPEPATKLFIGALAG